MGSLGLFIKSVAAFINFLRENSSYNNSIPKSVLFWCAITALINNVYQYNAVLLAEKEILAKNKYIVELERKNHPKIEIDQELINTINNINNKLDELSRVKTHAKPTQTYQNKTVLEETYLRYEKIRLKEQK